MGRASNLKKQLPQLSSFILQVSPLPFPPLELQPCAPEDILAGEITVSCGSIVEERGVPLLIQLHRKADSRVQGVSKRSR